MEEEEGIVEKGDLRADIQVWWECIFILNPSTERAL